jgi:excisionase family DNA binding protein
MQTDISDLLNKQQLAEKLNISQRTLNLWLAQRRIPHIRLGAIIRFDWAKVREALGAFEIKETVK